MLTPEMKEELASALATSAIGYAKMSIADQSLNILSAGNNLNSGTDDSTIPRGATGPLRKRKLLAISGDENSPFPSSLEAPAPKKLMTQSPSTSREGQITETAESTKATSTASRSGNEKSAAATHKARETRLEQNRIAARKSRMRKKTMIHNFHHSIMYYTRANAALQQENETLQKMLDMAKEFVKTNGENAEAGKQQLQQVPTGSVNANTSQEIDKINDHTQGDNSKSEIEVAAQNKPNTHTAIQNILEATKMLSETTNRIPQDTSATTPKSLSEIIVASEKLSGSLNEDKGRAAKFAQQNARPHNIAQSFSAAAACAANLQVAAANFQAALVASMGNPFLNQIGTQSSSPSALIQNYPLLMPYVSGFPHNPYMAQDMSRCSAGAMAISGANTNVTFDHNSSNGKNSFETEAAQKTNTSSSPDTSVLV